MGKDENRMARSKYSYQSDISFMWPTANCLQLRSGKSMFIVYSLLQTAYGRGTIFLLAKAYSYTVGTVNKNSL
jgi:hypothetical protein